MAYYTELRVPYTSGLVPFPTYESKTDGYPGGSEYLQRMNQPEIDAMLQYMDAQELNDPSAVLRRKLQTPPTPSLEDDPITVLRRNTDRARNYPRDFSEMFAPSMNPEGDIGRYIPKNPAVSRSAKVPPSSMGAPPSTGNVPMPVRTQTSAVKTAGLLDTEGPAEGGSFYDDPMRMGLLQAGLGLMSAPRYSTNPNDVTLGSALARGLGGFIQGYGGTKKRLSEAERQKLEDEYQRSVRDFNQRYMQTQMDATQKRLDNDEKTTTEKVLQKEQEKTQKQAIIADILTAEPDATATRRSALNRMSLEELNAERAVYFPSAATLQQQEKERMARERLAELTGQPAETYEGQPLDKLNAEILKQSEPPKPKTQELGEADERMFDSLNKGKRGDIPLGDPEYVNAYTRYYEKYLRPKTYPDGSSYLPTSQFDAPPDFKTAAVMGQGDLVSQVNTPGGSLIKRMDQKDKDAVRNLTSNISQLEEYENILSKIDINNLDRISQTSPEIADLQTLFKNLQLRLKDNPYGLGALTGPDMGLMEAILSDPTKADIMDWRAYLQNRPFYLAQANRLKKILVQDADSIYSDYSTSLADEFQRKYNRPLNWLEQEPTAEFRLSTRSEDILAEEEPAVSPMTNNGNESSFFDPLINILPDAIQNLGR